MAGLNCGSPSLLAWEVLSHTVNVFFSIPDIRAKKAIKLLNNPPGNDHSIKTCESGAAGLAGLDLRKTKKYDTQNQG